MSSTNFLAWKNAAPAHLVRNAEEHGMHSYYVTCPESPNGEWIVLFTSKDPEGQVGEVRIINRKNGMEKVLAEGVTAEDAHRQAYQQWIQGGKAVVYQDLRDGEWQVICVDIESLQKKVLARGRQVGFGAPKGTVIPLHGLHWAPGDYRNLELVDTVSGEIHTALTMDQVRKDWPEWIAKQFGTKPLSIFFPVLSPDGKRVFFKLSQVEDGKFRSPGASKREGLIAYDLENKKPLFLRGQWGHPAWSADSKLIITPQSVIINSDNGEETVIPGMPKFPGSHTGFHPDGRLVATDSYLRGENIPPGWWSIVVIDRETSEYCTVHEMHEANGGAKSWRPPHPHPVFSSDGQRLYFNVNQGGWTRLYVVDAAAKSNMAHK